MVKRSPMLIADFSKVTGLSRDTIRFYVRKGLLHPVFGSSENNRYQVFAEADVERAIMIKYAQSLGFTLREIATLDDEYSAGMTVPRQVALMQERVCAIDAQIASLRLVRGFLLRKIRWLDAGSVGTPPALTIRARQPARPGREARVGSA